MDIYIKPKRKVTIKGRDYATIKDVCDVLADDTMLAKINSVRLCKLINAENNCIVSVTDIVKEVLTICPNAKVENVGEIDTLVHFNLEKQTQFIKLLKPAKVIFVFLVLFTGSASAIMSFHSDAQMSEIFKNTYHLLYGVKSERPLIIEIPYAIGLASGITIFFNHIFGKKITGEPTPIQVEMVMYEKNVDEAVMSRLEFEKEASGK